MAAPSPVEQKVNKLAVSVRLVVGLLGVLFVLGLVLPVRHAVFDTNQYYVSTKNTESQVVAGIQSFKEEYDRFPGMRPNGMYEDPAGNAQIFDALRARDLHQNPHGVSFFEARNASHPDGSAGKPAKPRNGLDQETGVLFDVYGSPYRLRVRPASGRPLISPYRDLPAQQNDVLIWSLGKDGRQGNPADPQRFQGSDDVVSWLK